MTIDEYISSILPLILASRSCEPKDSHAAKHIHYLYGQAFYGFDEFAQRMASQEARKLYAYLGFDDDLALRSIHNQKEFDPAGRKDGAFHLEHVYTGTCFRQDVKIPQDKEVTIEKIKEIVSSKFILAWILKKEDKCLNQAGYRTFRPENPLLAYEELGIKLS